MNSSPALLEVAALAMRFGGLMAVDNVSFQVRRGQITALIGPNGAGKTTLFNCLTGFYRPTSGRLTLRRDGDARELVGLPAYKIARLGIVRTFQNIRLFSGMTAFENLLVAQHVALTRTFGSGLHSLLGTRRGREAEEAARARAAAELDHAGLREDADRPSGTLPYGAQRRLEIARALCADPCLLCLDEPAAGLNPRESVELARWLAGLRDSRGLSLLLIEHDMSVVMRLSDHVVVLDYGRKIAEGPPGAIRTDPVVIRAYLGEPDGEVA